MRVFVVMGETSTLSDPFVGVSTNTDTFYNIFKAELLVMVVFLS